MNARAARSGLSCMFALSLPLAAQAPPELAKAIVHAGIDDSHVMAFEDSLCHDFGARLTGSLAFERAAEWAREQFAAMGLQARLETWGEWQTGWDREQWLGRLVSPGELELQVATPAWTAATSGIARGTLVATPTTAAAVDGLRTQLEDQQPRWLWGPLPKEDAVRQAVLALLDQGKVLGLAQSAISTGYTDAQFPNQIRVFGDNRAPQRPYAQRQRWAHAVVRDDQAKVLDEKLAGSEPVVVEFELRNRFRPGPIALHNVVADLIGTEKPDEMVVVCAHLDSWHQAAGATDNGTGVCSTLEAARILTSAGAKPRRTIRFILWSGEEQGLLGSRQYVVQHRTAMHGVAAVFNHDSGTNWAQSLTVPESQAADFQKIVQPVLELLRAPQADYQGAVFEVHTQKVMQPAGGGSDHASFGAVGVPAFGWGQKGEVPYGRGWHSQWDTYSIVVPKYQQHTATVVALVAFGVADLDHLLSRQGVERAKPGGPVNAQLVAETWLGLELDGLQVKAVAAGGIAAAGGLQVGDAIAAVAGVPVTDAATLVASLRQAWDAGPALELGVTRGGQPVAATLTRR